MCLLLTAAELCGLSLINMKAPFASWMFCRVILKELKFIFTQKCWNIRSGKNLTPSCTPHCRFLTIHLILVVWKSIGLQRLRVSKEMPNCWLNELWTFDVLRILKMYFYLTPFLKKLRTSRIFKLNVLKTKWYSFFLDRRI